MVGIGKWSAKVNTLVFKGEITVDIRDNNGEYDIEFHLPEKFKNVEIGPCLIYLFFILFIYIFLL